MKPLNRISALLFLLLINISCAVQQQQPAYTQQQQPVNFQVFYDELSPYGQWVDYPTYGYVWLPEVRGDFSPYSTNGYWVNTEYGWTWVSDYQWGWAPFHYGRWDYDNFYGWFWVPDNQWGPSWVTWRSGNGYYGWAPMRPGMSINPRYDEDYRDINRWNFVRETDFGRSDINRYYIDRREYTTIINNSTVINNTTVDRRRNTTYVAGPPKDNVQRVTGRRINSVAIRDNDRPGQKLNQNELRIYRPQVDQTAGRGQRPAPSRVSNAQEIKSVRERNSNNPQNNVTPYENNRREQPGEQIYRRRRERQSQPIDRQPQPRQQTQPVQPTQQPQVTPQQQQYERRRQERQQGVQQPQSERVQPMTPPTPVQQERRSQSTDRQQTQPVQPAQQPQVTPQQQQYERRRQERQQGVQQPQSEKVQPVTPPTPVQQAIPPQQQQQTQPVQAPQATPPQIEQPAQRIERQEQQQQRRQERQLQKQQQRNDNIPSGNSRRERQKPKEAQ
ncbi:MAG TPA: DUF6600 domain-containing protein [Prolixibacteraceae bacterium]|jgi:hypothetical protein